LYVLGYVAVTLVIPLEPCVNLVADSAWEHAPLIIVVATSFVVATSKRRALANPPPW